MRHEPVVALQSSQNGARFDASKDDRNFRWTFGALKVDQLQFPFEDLLIEKKQSAEGLILGRSADLAVDGKMGKKRGDFFFAHLGRVPFLVKENEAASPIQVGLLGPDGIALYPQMPADAV